MINKIRSELKQGKKFVSFALLKTLGEGTYYILPLLIAKFVNPEQFGIFTLSYMIILLFATIFITSSQTPFIVLANKESNKANKINKNFSIQLSFFLFSIVFVSVIFFLFKDLIITFSGLDVFQLKFMLLAYFGIAVKSAFQNLFLALNEKMKNALYPLCVGILTIALVILFSILFSLKIEFIFLSYFLAPIIISVFSLFFVDLKKLFPLEFDNKLFSEIFHWTKWQICGLTAVYFINWGDNIVLRYFVTLEDIGTYNVAYQIFKGLIGITYIINTYYLPFISKNIDNKSKIRDYLYNKRPKIFLLFLVGIVGIFVLSPLIFNLIYGTKYVGSILIFRILLLALCFQTYIIFYIPLLNSLKKYKFTQITNIFAILINLVLDVIFTIKYGIYGPAIATTIAYLFLLVTYQLYFRRLSLFDHNNHCF